MFESDENGKTDVESTDDAAEQPVAAREPHFPTCVLLFLVWLFLMCLLVEISHIMPPWPSFALR